MKLLELEPVKVAAVVGFALAMMAGPLSAQVYTDTLADLSNPNGTYNSLTIGDKTFSHFSYLGTDLTSFDPSQIVVAASIASDGTYDLTWGGNVSLATLNTATADLKLNYVVTATDGLIAVIDQSYTGSAQNGLLAIDENAYTQNFGQGLDGNSHLNTYDVSDPPAESTDLLNLITPASTLFVTKDIGLAGFSPGSFVTISEVTQSFHQVPEPGAVMLTALGGGVLLLLRLRRPARVG